MAFAVVVAASARWSKRCLFLSLRKYRMGVLVLVNRPQTAVLHIVRHPGGFLNSWRNRYLANTSDPR